MITWKGNKQMLPETKRKIKLIQFEMGWFVVGLILAVVCYIKGDNAYGLVMTLYCMICGTAARITLLQDKISCLKTTIENTDYEIERLRSDCFASFERKK